STKFLKEKSSPIGFARSVLLMWYFSRIPARKRLSARSKWHASISQRRVGRNVTASLLSKVLFTAARWQRLLRREIRNISKVSVHWSTASIRCHSATWKRLGRGSDTEP